MEVQNSVREDIQLVLKDTREAVVGINKNSKLRMHYLRLVMMNNIMKAFVVLYEVDKEFIKKQEVLLETLKRVEQRKNRQWFTSDKIAVQVALESFVEIMESAQEDQFLEVMQTVETNKYTNSWIVYKDK